MVASPLASTLTFTCPGPRQTLPAMTRAGTQGKRARVASVVKTAGEATGASGTAAGTPSSVTGTGAGRCWAGPRWPRR